jgi:hypothetical protein
MSGVRVGVPRRESVRAPDCGVERPDTDRDDTGRPDPGINHGKDGFNGDAFRFEQGFADFIFD